MTATFTYIPSLGFQKASKPRVLVAQFGEGYQQRMSDGLNTQNTQWSLQFINKPKAMAEAIELFLATAGTGDVTEGGKAYFYWNPPGENATYRVICQDWSIEYTSSFSATVSATFIRVFEV